MKWPCATVFAGAGLLGSFIGSSLAKAVDGQRLLLFFSVAMAAIALSMLRRPKSEGDPAVHISGALSDGSPLIPMNVTFTDLKVPLSKTINGRGTITIPKASLPIATSSSFVRFNAIVTWVGGGRREVGLMYQRR